MGDFARGAESDLSSNKKMLTMKKIKFQTQSPAETIKLGEKIAKFLSPGQIICLSGNLGAGKTTLTKGIAKGLKIDPALVNSPTFVIMNAYQGKLPLYHFDLYRLNQMQEMGLIGYDEFLYGEGVSLIEWGERLEKLLPKEYLSIQITQASEKVRTFCLEAVGAHYGLLLNKIREISL